ncbi:hypothetical protein PPACK8108_LOCUS18070 [Phakopsora pachyrhizi]|uniref:Uncharacterized protein n=1 Tax=Phakopsora pachyrhizi TaxID=170000 RepID=A0AAV0BCT4_PHAPC|nr:hypothetical protein PPACK8108_LOCUS18070 [Phakopsora pachyrhizi]
MSSLETEDLDNGDQYEDDTSLDTTGRVHMIDFSLPDSTILADIQAVINQPQSWDISLPLQHIEDARALAPIPDFGRAHLSGKNNITKVICNNQITYCLIDGGASCSVVSNEFLTKIVLNWEENLIPVIKISFRRKNTHEMRQRDSMSNGEDKRNHNGNEQSLDEKKKIDTEFVVMSNSVNPYFVLGNDYLSRYGFDVTNSRGRYFTVGGNTKKKFSFGPDPFHQLVFTESEISPNLSQQQREILLQMLTVYKTNFAKADEPLGEIFGHELNITLTCFKQFPPLLRRPAYPYSPKSRLALEEHFQQLTEMGVVSL